MKLSLEADEPQVSQRHGDTERSGKTTTYYFLSKDEILRQEVSGQVNNTLIEHFNSVLFHNSKPANKQHTNQSINQSINGIILAHRFLNYGSCILHELLYEGDY